MRKYDFKWILFDIWQHNTNFVHFWHKIRCFSIFVVLWYVPQYPGYPGYPWNQLLATLGRIWLCGRLRCFWNPGKICLPLPLFLFPNRVYLKKNKKKCCIPCMQIWWISLKISKFIYFTLNFTWKYNFFLTTYSKLKVNMLEVFILSPISSGFSVAFVEFHPFLPVPLSLSSLSVFLFQSQNVYGKSLLFENVLLFWLAGENSHCHWVHSLSIVLHVASYLYHICWHFTNRHQYFVSY